MSMSESAFPPSGHDHHICVDSALRGAERYCESQGLRLTPTRRRVLELIWQSHRPSGAYELLEQLASDGRKPSPPTVYRALDFLLENALIHRVTSRNAYVGCTRPGDRHMAQIFVCDRCGVAVEQADAALNRHIRHNAQDLQFRIRTQTLELTGLCPLCTGDSGDA